MEHTEPQLLNCPPTLITLFELKCLGEFTRYQDLGHLLAIACSNAPPGYPLFATRLKPNKYIDLFLSTKWELVEFIKIENSHIYYRRDSLEEKIPFSKYCVAPAGLYTAYDGDISTINSATLSKLYKPSTGSFVTGCEVHSVSPPYLTLQIEDADGRGSSGWYFETFHIADPRIQVDGIVPHQPFFNSPIAVSHRWLSETHPDPNRVQIQELLGCAKT